MHGIEWAIVQRMIVDAPGYDDEKSASDIVLTEDNAEQVAKLFNGTF